MKTAPPETSPNGPPLWFADILSNLVDRRDLTAEQMRQVIHEMMAGRCGEVEMAVFLTALRTKGESAAEIAAAAEVLREHMVCLETGRHDVLDTCGTGGDGIHTFNISTAASFVIAATGVPVVKHGNRAMSSRSGSADVLTALGVKVDGDVACVRRALDLAGMAFCYAPSFHPALRHVGAVRRRLRFATLFNCLGPLANPARASYQLLGVGRPELLDLLAGALARLGVRKALLVCGHDGLGEVSLSAPTRVREVRAGSVTAWDWTPAEFGMEPCSLNDLLADGPEESAAIIRTIMNGEDGAPTRVVLANAAAGLLAAERVRSAGEGVDVARAALKSGKAGQVLARLIECSRGSVSG